MIKVLAGAGLLLVIVASAAAVHRHHVLSRQRSLSAYSAITSYHEKVVAAAAVGKRFIPERSPEENLFEGDPGYPHLKRMAQAAEELSLRATPLQENSRYEACDILARHDLNLPFDPKHSYTMSMEIAKAFCG